MSIATSFSLAFVLIVVTFGAQIHSLVSASNSTGANGTLNLGSPLFIEHYNIVSSNKTMVNGTEATEVVILGNGNIKGINITSTGKALVIPRSDGVPYIEGAADFKTNGGNATYTFQAIGNYGAAFFNSNATGNLSFLNNMVGIYKVDRIEGGDDIFTMWNWSSPRS